MNDGKEACQAVLKPAVDCVNAVKQYGSDKYNQGKEQVLSTDTVKYKNICQNENKERMNLTIVRTGILYIGSCIYQYSSTTKIISMNVLDCDFVYRWKKLCRWEQTLLNP